MKIENFKNLLNKEFEITLEGGNRIVVLDECRAHKKLDGFEDDSAIRSDPFSLYFKGVGDDHLPSGTYEMKCDGNDYAMMIGPIIDVDLETTTYEAVFG